MSRNGANGAHDAAGQASELRALRFGTVTSTMDVAKQVIANQISAEGNKETDQEQRPFAIFADSQTQGRGRRGKSWIEVSESKANIANTLNTEPLKSSAGQGQQPWGRFTEGPFLEAIGGEASAKHDGLMFSIAFPREAIPIPLEWFSIAAGCALYDAIEDVSVFLASSFSSAGFASNLAQRRIYLKWPNDLVFVDEQQLAGAPDAAAAIGKIAGTLVETSFSGPVCQWVILGIGVNLLGAPQLNTEGAPDAPGAPGQSPGVLGALPLSAVSSFAMRTMKDRCRWVDKWLLEKGHRELVIRRFLESLERELLEYLCVPRTIGQLRSLGMARMLPVGTLLTLPEQGRTGTFEGLGDDAALIMTGSDAVHAGEVSVRLGGQGDHLTRGTRGPQGHAASSAATANLRWPSKGSSRDGAVFSPSSLSPKDPAKEVSRDFAKVGAAGRARVACTLLLDLGNTRLHWALQKDPGSDVLVFGNVVPESLRVQVRPGQADPSLRDLLEKIHAHRRDDVQILTCSVRRSDETRQVMDRFRAWLSSCYPEMRVTLKLVDLPWLLEQSAGLQAVLPDYGSTLGVDRALKIDFAFRKALEAQSAVAILSLGTATTVEIVGWKQRGTYASAGRMPELLESMILPGMQASFDALADSTALLPRLEVQGLVARDFEIAEGQGTRASLARGVVGGVAAVCAALCERYGVHKLWICGGGANLFASFGLLQDFPVFDSVGIEFEEHLALRSLAALRPESPGSEGRPFKPLIMTAPVQIEAPSGISSGLPPNSTSIASAEGRRSFGFGALSDQIAATLFQGRKHFRKMIAATRRSEGEHDEESDSSDEDAPDVEAPGASEGGTGDHAGVSFASLDPEDFRRLGQRIESHLVGERIDRHLGLRFRFHSREEWRDRILKHEVLVEHDASRVRTGTIPFNVQRPKHTYRLKPFDQLWLYQPPQFEPGFVKEANVLVDWGDAIAFQKPGNLVVHATGLYGRNTFLDVLQEQGFQNVFPVHRIDRETSGILLCARTPGMRRSLAELFREGAMHKMYLAVTKNLVETPTEFVVNAPIGPAVGSEIRLKMWVGEQPGSQEAVTRFVRLAVVNDSCLYACFPLTGRTNQIRVHLSAMGQWILGDKMYHPSEQVFLSYFEHGLSEAVLKAIEIPRQALHHAALSAPAEASEIFAGGAIVCPMASDLMELRMVRDLFEEASLGLSEAVQLERLRELSLRMVADGQEQALPVFGLTELREPTLRAAERCPTLS